MYQHPFHTVDLSQSHFLVTGGAGFIGSHIVEYLLLHGAKKVRVLDNLSTGFIENIELFQNHPNYEFIEGDMRDFETCLRACEGMNYISHQAAIGSVPRSIANPILTNSANVSGFVNIVKAACEKGIQRMVYASSSSVYGDEPNLPKVEANIGQPLSPYAVSKLTNELYANVFSKVYNIELIGWRYFNVFGPRQSPKGAYAAVIPLFIEGLQQEKAVYINGDGEQTRDFTFVSNAVQANILGMLTTNKAAVNQVYNVAVGKRYSVNELYAYIAQQLNSQQQPTYRAPRLGDIPHSLASIEKAEQLLTYQPTVSFYEGLDKTISYFEKGN